MAIWLKNSIQNENWTTVGDIGGSPAPSTRFGSTWDPGSTGGFVAIDAGVSYARQAPSNTRSAWEWMSVTPSSGNAVVSATVSIPAPTDSSILIITFMTQSNGDGYHFYYSGGFGTPACQFHKVVSGVSSFVQGGNGAYTFSGHPTTALITFEKTSNTIVLKIDNVTLFTITDTGTPWDSGGVAWLGRDSNLWDIIGTDDSSSGPIITGPSGSAGAATSTANLAENSTTGPTFSTDIALTGGYPTLTGTDSALFTIVNPSGNNFRVDPVTTFNFESLPHANPFIVTFNASAAVSQTCTITVTNVSEPPGPPTGVSATAGNTNATVSFTAPVNTGKPAITGYTVTSSPGGLTGTGASSPITVSGLTNGTAYTFTVTATNSEGTGTASSASNSVTPSGAITSVTTSPFANLSGSLHLNETVYYSWFPTGRAGSLNGITPIEGTAVTSASTGTVTLTGLPSGSGILLLCIRGTDGTLDLVSYQALTIS